MFDISSFILDIYWTGQIKSLAVTQEINFRRVAAMFSLYGSAQKCNHFGQYRRDLFEFRQNRIDNRPAVSGLTLLLFIKDPALRRRRKLLLLHNACLFDIVAVNCGKIILHGHGFKSEFFALLVEFGGFFSIAVIAFGIVA